MNQPQSKSQQRRMDAQSTGDEDSKPTIAELEDAIERGEDVHLNPDGSVGRGDEGVLMFDQLSIGEIARVCHEVNRAYCQSLGDDSQPPWEEAPEWQQQSAINGVEFHLANPNSSPSDSHESWLAEKKMQGWVWGEEKDPEKKTHPCMLHFHQLPREQQAKDYLFLGVVRALAPGS